MKYTIALSSGILFLLLSTTSCFKDKACRDKTPLTGAFKVEEAVGGLGGHVNNDRYDFVTRLVDSTDGAYYSETDTIIAGQRVLFTALEEADRYEWTIGSDPRTFEGKQFSLRFFSGVNYYSFPPTSIGVTLRAFRDDPHCFPEDTFAVQHREVVFVPIQQSAILGQYRGTSTRFEGEPHEIDIMLAENELSWYTSIDNFPKGCSASMQSAADTLRGVRCSIGYKSFVVSGGTYYRKENCYHTVAVGRLNADNRLRVDYYLAPDRSGFSPIENASFVYEGTKIQ